MQLMWFSVDLCETIRSVITLLVSMLKDGDEDVQSAAALGVGELIENGESDYIL